MRHSAVYRRAAAANTHRSIGHEQRTRHTATQRQYPVRALTRPQHCAIAHAATFFSSSHHNNDSGVWKFLLASGVDKAPTGFEHPRFRDDNWGDIRVPGHWQLQDAGASDPPIYTNTNYPFPNHPPYAPRKNPTGLYRRTFSVPAEWIAPGGEGGIGELDERILVGEVRVMGVCVEHTVM